MTTTLKRLRKTNKPKRNPRLAPTSPDHITLYPPGEMLEEKIGEMGINAAEFAKRMETPLETVEQLVRADIPLTQKLADKIEQATGMPASFLMRLESHYHDNLTYDMRHPKIPAYLGSMVVNQLPVMTQRMAV